MAGLCVMSDELADQMDLYQTYIWDRVLIQRPDYGGGEIHFDGELIRKNGRFTLPELKPLDATN